MASNACAANDEILFGIDGNTVVMQDIAADLFDDVIRDYVAPLYLHYKFNNPGVAIVGKRPNPDIDPLRVDTSTETWIWRKGMPYIYWDKLHLISPLKELIKEFTFYKIQRLAYTSAANVALELIEIQDRLKDPTAYPWSQDRVLAILAGLRTKYDNFYAFKEFYLWAANNGKPGFDESIAWSIRKATTSKSDEFVYYAGVKQRKHVLTLDEDIAIRNGVVYQPSSVKLPALTDPNTPHTLEEVAHWFGRWPMVPRAAKADNTYMHSVLKDYRAMLVNLKVPAIDIPKDERIASVTGYKAQVYYPAGDVIPALRKYIVRNHLIQLRSKILTHLSFALGARPAQLVGIDEENFVRYDPDGDLFYSIEIPSRKKRSTTTVKQSGNGGKPKVIKQAKRRKFPEEIGLGQKIEALIALKREAEALGILTIPKGRAKPLLISDCTQTVLSGDRPNEQDCTASIENFLKKQLGVNRSAKDLRANVAQRLADAGYPAQVIADTLDHESIKNVQFYVHASLKLSEVQDMALAKSDGYQRRMKKLAGVIWIKKENITPETDVISGVVGHTLVSGIGACDRKRKGMGPCENEPVYSCYGGCPAFQPFDDIAVHEKVLDALKGEAVEYLEEVGEEAEPTRMAISNQELIAEVSAIIQVIEESQA